MDQDPNYNNMLQSAKEINKMYKNITYFDEYGGSVFLFILITILLFIGHSYSVIMLNIKPIREDWQAQRCKPSIIPFAGLINPPGGMSASEYTSENFQYCMQNILISISGDALKPITYTTSLLTDVYSEMSQSMNYITQMIANVRSSMTTFGENVMSRTANVTVPLQTILISIKDYMNKVQGIFSSALYTSLSTYYILKSLMGAILEAIIIILTVLIVIFFMLSFFPNPYTAVLGTIIYSISIPLIIIIAFMTEVLDVHVGNAPSANMCFDKNTLIRMADGKMRKIVDVQAGDELWNNSRVTAKLVLNAKNVEMFKMKGVIVSADHCVQYHDLFLPVRSHPDSERIIKYKEPLIYCLNTSKKYIQSENYTFLDWDEVLLKEETKLKSALNLDIFDDEMWIHRYFDSGFNGKTRLTNKYGEEVEIKDLKVGDVLSNGEIVCGVVEIDGTDLECKEFCFKDVVVEGGPNLQICEEVGMFSTLNKDFMREKQYLSESVSKNEKLYHILTNTETFLIKGIKFGHYNFAIDLFLEE
jgi:hypothetical protein